MNRDVFTTIRSEGGILPPDLLSRVAALSSDLEAIGPEGYHLAANERLGEAITRSWSRMTGAWDGFKETLASLPASDAATSVTRSRWLLVLFQELGYGQLQTAKAIELEGKSYAISHVWGAVPMHLVGANVDLDRRSPGVAGAASATPHGLVQEVLNRTDERLWGFVSNGRRLRVLRDNAALTRQAFVEFDLEAMFDGQQYADFAVLWLVCHQSRVEGDVPEKFVLERWMADAVQQGTRALDHLRDGVEQAIEHLGAGFLAHATNAALRERLRSGELANDDYQRQLLRVVYRLLFLLVAEARELLLRPDADAAAIERYQRFYSVARLRSIAEVSRGGPHGDLWRGLSVVSASLGRNDGLPSLALPALGSFLWSDEACADLDNADLANRDLLAALRALSSVRDGKVTRAVDYRNLGAEELGSIYESLLELHPDFDVDAKTFKLTTAAGHQRKTTGSYYTPSSLVSELLDSALEPVIDEAAANGDPGAAILALTVLDPACGSGHFLIAAAHRIARRLAAVRTGEVEPSPVEVRTALRDVVGRCLYGIDINPMAVELCKVSLWMEAMEPGKPLSFLDHHIVCGNALLGTTPELLAKGVPDEAFKLLPGDDGTEVTARRLQNRHERRFGDQLSLAFDEVASDLSGLADAMTAVEIVEGTSIDEVRSQERLWHEAEASIVRQRLKLAANAWCAAFVAPRNSDDTRSITNATINRLLHGDSVAEGVVSLAERCAADYRFLHFHLEFPRVVRDGRGFSAVVGNPPWDTVEFKELEWFATEAPAILSATTGAARKRAISTLLETDQPLSNRYLSAVRHADGERHLLTASGRYPLCGHGRVNTSSVFAELMVDVVDPNGRVGGIFPLGLATDETTSAFFRDIMSRKRLVRLYGFENEARIFEGVHNQVKFCLMAVAGTSVPVPAAEFSFFSRSTADLRDPDRTFHLTADDLALLNPESGTSPVFRRRRDVEYALVVYARNSLLGSLAGLGFRQGLLNSTGDSHRFITDGAFREGAVSQGMMRLYEGELHLPVFEGKMLHQLTHRYGGYEGQTEAQANKGVLPPSDDDKLKDPTFFTRPRYWVRESEFETRADVLFCYRRMTRNVDERTAIGALVPQGAPNDTAAIIFSEALWLPAVFNSFAFDYLLRQKHGGSTLGVYVLKQIPVPPASSATDEIAELVGITAELAFTSWDAVAIGHRLGYEVPFKWDRERRSHLWAQLNATVFHFYGIERDDVDYIMETFPIIKRKDEKEHGNFRTKRLILEVHDAMAKAIETGEPYQTVLDPPPADPSRAHPESTRPEWAR